MAGASGLVGREILKGLLADNGVAAVHTLGRRPVAAADPRLTHHTVDFASLPALPLADEVYIALGTTIRVAGSQQAFRAIDFDAVVAVARAARTAGATRLGVVSAMGADAQSAVFYNRVKGEMEYALAGLGYVTLVIARPSLLAGDREALGQPLRASETIGLAAASLLKPLIPRNLRPIRADAVAAALLIQVKAGRPGVHTMLSGAMQPA